MRRTQRSSQRSAVSGDSKLTSQTGDSGVVSQVSQVVTTGVDTDHSRSEETQRNGSKKSTSLVVDMSPPPIVTVDTPDNNTVTLTNGAAVVSNGGDKERMSARDRSAGTCLQISS